MTESAGRRKRVVVVADHLLVADVVVIALTNHGFDSTSVDLADGGRLSTVLPAILDDPPDVLLLDLDLGSHSDGSLFIAPLVRTGVEVVVMTANHEDAVRALEAGSRSLVSKTSSLADLVETLEALLSGDPSLPAPV